jgi:hypothetical protein
LTVNDANAYPTLGWIGIALRAPDVTMFLY